MRHVAIALAAVAALAVAGCQNNPKLDAFLGVGNNCQKAENAYAAFRIASGNKSTKQVEAFMAGIRAAAAAGSDCQTLNLAQLAQAIAAGRAVLGVK